MGSSMKNYKNNQWQKIVIGGIKRQLMFNTSITLCKN